MNEKITLLRQFVKTRWLSRISNRKALQKYQDKLLEKQWSFIRKHSAFYQEKSDLPVIDKKIFMEQFDCINTVGLTKNESMNFALQCERERDFAKKLKGVTVGLSSGTSGHRGVFLVSDKERSLWAGTMLAKTLPKRHLHGVKIAFFMRADSNLYETVQSRLIKFRFFDMQRDISQHFEKLKEFKPTILVAPPSCLLKIAEWNAAQQISPKKIISIAEVLEQADAERIKTAFQTDTIHQVYQCTEGFLGVTCEYGVLHINEDIIHVEKEWLDERRFLPIITDLRRRAQPIIRYRLNDVLVEKKEPCKCGSPFTALEKIEGRQDDIFEFDGENGKITVFPDFVRRCILFADGIDEYRIQQISPSKILVLANGLTEKTKHQITDEFRKLAKYYCFTAPNIEFQPYQYDMSRKLKRVEKLC